MPSFFSLKNCGKGKLSSQITGYFDKVEMFRGEHSAFRRVHQEWNQY
jgi:hypothetical protein